MNLSLPLALTIIASSIAGAQMPREIPAAPLRDIGAAYAWLRPQDTVRVWAREPKLNGGPAAFQRVTNGTIQLSTVPGLSGRARPLDVAGSSITRLDVLQRESRGAGRRFGYTLGRGLIGAAVGTFAGVIVGSGESDDPESYGDDRSIASAIYGAMGFVVGGTVGLVYGGIKSGRPRAVWRPLYEAGR